MFSGTLNHTQSINHMFSGTLDPTQSINHMFSGMLNPTQSINHMFSEALNATQSINHVFSRTLDPTQSISHMFSGTLNPTQSIIMCIVQLVVAENCLISLNVRNYRRNQTCSSTVQGTQHSAVVKYIIIYHSADTNTFDFFVVFFFYGCPA